MLGYPAHFGNVVETADVEQVNILGKKGYAVLGVCVQGKMNGEVRAEKFLYSLGLELDIARERMEKAEQYLSSLDSAK